MLGIRQALTAALLSLQLANVMAGQQAWQLTGDIESVHDPSAIHADNQWYVFATGHTPAGGQISIRCSPDGHDWHRCGSVFPSLPAWIAKESPSTKDLWAPDITYVNGEYRLYYTWSIFGKNTSGIALATNHTLDPSKPDYRWVDRGAVVRSHSTDDWNAIDPNLFAERGKPLLLTFGSFWSGIQQIPVSADGVRTLCCRRTVAARPKSANHAVEAPFLYRRGDNYYLFVSWDICCHGAAGTYRVVVGRASKPSGPFVDQRGTLLTQGGGTPVLEGDGNPLWAGPGGQSVIHEGDLDLLIFHAYDRHSGKPVLHISSLAWNDGWPKAALQ